MAMASEVRTPEGSMGAPQLDELQRSQEPPPTVEVLERTPRPSERGQLPPVPDPGERPRAIRMDHPAPAEGTGAK